MPSPIDKAIDQLEKSVEKIREFSVNESKAVQKAVRDSSGSAKSRVETDYSATRKRLLKEAKDAEKSIKEALTRIEKALADANPVKRTAKPAAKKKPARKTTARAAAKKKPAAKKAAAKKPVAKKPVAKKAAATKTAAKKTATKAASKVTRKPAAKKTTRKPAAKKKPAARKSTR